MALVRDFKVSTNGFNAIGLSWNQPLDFNNSLDEIVVSKTSTHFPVELYNPAFPNKATDPRPIEIFRGSVITGLNPLTVTVVGNVITDTSASFPVSPFLVGRLLRDGTGSVFKIISNTITAITVNSLIVVTNGVNTVVNPTPGKYVILADFPSKVRFKQFLYSAVAGSGQLTSITEAVNSNVISVAFIPDELANLVFVDGNGTKFIIKSNTVDTIYFFDTATPVVSSTMFIADSFFNSSPYFYIDTYNTATEAATRNGTGLLDDVFYYYTVFTIPIGANVAQAQFGLVNSVTSTQSTDLSISNEGFGDLLYNLWPSVFRELDTTGDLQDLMSIFGFEFNILYCLVKTYNLQDPQTVFYTALAALSDQFGMPSVGYALGIDTLRRIAAEIITCYKMKGSKEGIARFIRVLTTWDVTDGTGDYSESIVDSTLGKLYLTFWSTAPIHGGPPPINVRLVTPDPFADGGRFIKPLPGIIIPGFTTIREFTIDVQEVALFVGVSSSFTVSNNTTTMADSTANFGGTDNLVGNFLLPNQQEYNNLYLIVSNTSTSITVKSIITDLSYGGSYAVLSPLNTNRFIVLNSLLSSFTPFKTRAVISFT